MMTSLDGFIAGPNGELDWHVAGGDFPEYVDRVLRSGVVGLYYRPAR
jgi:hypothetical protein